MLTAGSLACRAAISVTGIPEAWDQAESSRPKLGCTWQLARSQQKQRLQSERRMNWTFESRYKILLSINNATINQTTREDLFKALATEVRRHFQYARLSINLYDLETESLSYFAAADGVNPEGISCEGSRPIAMGSIAQMVISSKLPVIVDDLRLLAELSSVASMLQSGLCCTMAFPLMIRNRILGSIHFSFKTKPDNFDVLGEVLTDVSRQVSISVDNMLAHTKLKQINERLESQKRYLMTNTEAFYGQEDFFHASSSMAEIMSLIGRVADTDASVLITGETGTGKDCLAKTVHDLSSRRDHLFVKVNCPALAASLIESELFGHSKGAFTGADSRRIGRFEMADKGTLFLDEVGDLPANLQAKMLHVLQDHAFERVGESRSINVNVRIIAATNQDLEKDIQAGRFRRDLYYRLNTVTVNIPPLRERREDIPLLVVRLTAAEAKQTNRPAPEYATSAMERLCHYHWPGNVRELKNFVKRMVILRPGDRISETDIDRIINPFRHEADASITTLAETECHHIQKALIKCGGLVGGPNGAARLLGLPRSTLQYRLKKCGLNPGDYMSRRPLEGRITPVRFQTGDIREIRQGLPSAGLLRCGRHSLTALRRPAEGADPQCHFFDRAFP
jgi:transcriptional regulator with GAF, ATPase, and Fis domain